MVVFRVCRSSIDFYLLIWLHVQASKQCGCTRNFAYHPYLVNHPYLVRESDADGVHSDPCHVFLNFGVTAVVFAEALLFRKQSTSEFIFFVSVTVLTLMPHFPMYSSRWYLFLSDSPFVLLFNGKHLITKVRGRLVILLRVLL